MSQINADNIGSNMDNDSNSTSDIASEYLILCRKLNLKLDSEFSDGQAKQKSTRLYIFIKGIMLDEHKLLKMYKEITYCLCSDYYASQLSINLNSSSSGSSLALARIIKLIELNIEITRLIVDLTSPIELLQLNRQFIYSSLSRFEVNTENCNQFTFSFDESDSEFEDDQARILNHKDYSTYLSKFKELFVKLDLFNVFGENMLKTMEYLNSVSAVAASNETKDNSKLQHLSARLFDSVLISQCLIRNLLIEKDQQLLNEIIINMMDAKFDQIFVDLCSINKPNKDDNALCVFYSILSQLNSLVFSTYSAANSKSAPSTSMANSNGPDKQLYVKLTKFGTLMCKSGSFGSLVANIIYILNKPNIELSQYSDVSYFIWLVKFFTTNFLLKRLDAVPGDSASTTCEEVTGCNYETTNVDSTESGPFLNNVKSTAAIKTKRVMLSYDLLSFLCYSMLHNFEKLLFDSNAKNVDQLREHIQTSDQIKQVTTTKAPPVKTDAESKPKPKKLVNVRYLKLLYLSISCIHEIFECVNSHLEYLNSASCQNASHTKQDDDYLYYLNEFINFDELKQSFALMMRFYCYNQHLYSDSLIKILIICNQRYLTTYRYVHDLIRQMQLKEQEKECCYELNSDTNATKNSSTISSLTLKPINIFKIYDMYANTDTSFIIKQVLINFETNDPILNRSCIDFLDSLMIESHKHEKLFHMNLALALANITLIESFRLLDQRTKDLISSILCEIRGMCKRKPLMANRILFDVRNTNAIENDSVSNKRMKLDTSGSENVYTSENSPSDDSKTTQSSFSSLRSSSLSNSSKEGAAETTTGNSIQNKQLKLLIENEFLFCLRSLDVFNKTSSLKRLDASKICLLITRNDHLYRIINYMVQLFEPLSTTSNNQQQPQQKVSSWVIYNILMSMKFDMNDKINYLNQINLSSSHGGQFSLGINLGFGPMKNEFFKSTDCVHLRVACSTDEFRKQLKEAYVKYLIETLCIKSKRTRNAIFWLFNLLKKLKLYVMKKSFYLMNNSAINNFDVAHTQNLSAAVSLSASSSSLLLLSASTSIFQLKLFSYYHINNLNIPLIPFSYEIQCVFHSVDFSRLLDLLGIVSSDSSFPYIPVEWLNKNKNKLNECLSFMEKCLCI